MASLSYAPDNSDLSGSPSKEKFHEGYLSKETIDQPCDVILVVEDCKEFKAHSRVLSKASPFFEKLLNIDMKESKEGIVRLEMFSESVLQNMLEFIYAGKLQILNEDNAKDLIIMADYLFLQNLKTRAERDLLRLQKLNTSNCISAYHFSERYRCEELFIKTKKFILANFPDVYKANSEGVLNMSNKEIEMWISSDEINVSSEEDVFKIILAWIDHDKSKRKRYFAELFRQLRLVFISRDFLCSDIVTNDFVTSNEECLDRVMDAVKLIDSRNYDNLPVQPRKSLESPAIIITSAISMFRDHDWELHDQDILCYFTREDKWRKVADMPHRYLGRGQYLSLQGKLYSRGPQLNQHRMGHPLVCYSLYSNCWMALPYKEGRELLKLFVSEDSIYTLGTEFAGHWMEFGAQKRVSYITKYKPESNSWEDITSFDHLDKRISVCIIAKDNFIYFIGGHEKISCRYLTDVDRYDVNRNQWEKRADMQQPKCSLSAAVVNGKIFITGRTIKPGTYMILSKTYQCEVYSEITNEWQIITSFHLTEDARPILSSVDDKLYVLSTLMSNLNRGKLPDTRVECYDPEKNEWNTKTEVPILTHPTSQTVLNPYSVRIFKGFLSDYQLKSVHTNVSSCPSKLHGEARPNKHKCSTM